MLFLALSLSLFRLSPPPVLQASCLPRRLSAQPLNLPRAPEIEASSVSRYLPITRLSFVSPALTWEVAIPALPVALKPSCPLTMLSMPTNIGLAAARRLIDEEYLNTEARLLLLKSQRNTFTNIATIPDEILLDIFSILQRNHDVKIWFCATQVCHHWRRISINMPSLWTNPPTRAHNLTLLFLERSMPLCLDVHFDAKTSTETAITVSHHIHRIQTLNIIRVRLGLLHSMRETLLRLGHQASNLKELSIHPQWPAEGTFLLSASTFPNPLLLETLSLRLVDLDWVMFPLPSLTTLALTYMDMSAELLWQEFLKILGAMPLLESAQLNLAELRLHTPSTSTKTVTLPQLSKLKIHGASDTQIRYFVSKIILPQLSWAWIICTTCESNDNHINTIQALSSLITEGNFGTLNTMLLGYSNFSLRQNINRSDEEFSFTYRDLIQTKQEAVGIVTNSVLNISSLNSGGISTLVHASLCGYGTPSDNDIADLFAGLPLLESLTLCDEMAMPFIDSFFIPIHTPVTGNIPFASLKVISFVEESEETQFCSELFQKVVNCLMQRCEYGVPIKELSISWMVTEGELKALKEIVVDVDFDLFAGIAQRT